jgi:hypothetical protein
VQFSHGNYGRGVLYGVLAISDVFLVKSIVTGGGKLLLRAGGTLLASEAERNAPRLVLTGSETQWGAALRPPAEHELRLSGWRLAPNPAELQITRVETSRVLQRAAEVGSQDVGHNFPALLDPMIFSSDTRYLRPGALGHAPSITYSAAGSIGLREGVFEIGVLEGGPGIERIIHRSFSQRIPSL